MQMIAREGRYGGTPPLERVGGNEVPTRERLFPKKNVTFSLYLQIF